MKKIAIFTLSILLLIGLIIFVPKIMQKNEENAMSKVQNNNKILTSKILADFEHQKNEKASIIAKKNVEELNKTIKNPYNKKEEFFTFEKECAGCSSVEYDDGLQMVIITTYDNKGELSARTVIKPPSFVVFDKKESKQD